MTDAYTVQSCHSIGPSAFTLGTMHHPRLQTHPVDLAGLGPMIPTLVTFNMCRIKQNATQFASQDPRMNDSPPHFSRHDAFLRLQLSSGILL
jgi:hypothetical protein